MNKASRMVKNEVTPGPPLGIYLAQFIDSWSNDFSMGRLAAKIEKPEAEIKDLIAGGHRLDQSMADKLAEWFYVPTEVWFRYDERFGEWTPPDEGKDERKHTKAKKRYQ